MSPNPTRRRLRALAVLAAAAVAAVVGGVPALSDAVYVTTSGNGSSWSSGILAGVHAPAGGMTSFEAAATGLGTCELSWPSLAGGATVADRLEVLEAEGGTTVTTTGGVAAGTATVSQDQAVRSYRLRTRAGSAWLAGPGDERAATCTTAGAVSVAAGQEASCAVKADGTMWCWGDNPKGQLGDGTTTGRSTPVAVVGGTAIAPGTASTATGDQHSCAVRADESVWCWGLNADGQLGDGTTTDASSPEQVL
jgi:hypothetical protein